MLQPVKQSLAEQNPWRYVDLRRDNTIQIGWDCLILHLRMADLIALSDALELLSDELEPPPAATCRSGSITNRSPSSGPTSSPSERWCKRPEKNYRAPSFAGPISLFVLRSLVMTHVFLTIDG